MWQTKSCVRQKFYLLNTILMTFYDYVFKVNSSLPGAEQLNNKAYCWWFSKFFIKDHKRGDSISAAGCFSFLLCWEGGGETNVQESSLFWLGKKYCSNEHHKKYADDRRPSSIVRRPSLLVVVRRRPSSVVVRRRRRIPVLFPEPLVKVLWV